MYLMKLWSRLIGTSSCTTLKVSQKRDDELTGYELEMLRQHDCCPDCNRASDLYRVRSQFSEKIIYVACGGCGAQFVHQKLTGVRTCDRDEVNYTSLKYRFHFTDDMLHNVRRRRNHQKRNTANG